MVIDLNARRDGSGVPLLTEGPEVNMKAPLEVRQDAARGEARRRSAESRKKVAEAERFELSMGL
jgi:hypothetical protein